MSKPGKINVTTNYALFKRSADNRPTDIKKHKRLVESLKKYGMLECFPIVCWRDAEGNLIVLDGQHRLMIAQSMGLPVYWVETATRFDIAVINCAARTWMLRDYAQTYAAQGRKDYAQGLEFAKQHSIPVGMAFALLAGTVSFGNCEGVFVQGEFKVRDRDWADAVAHIYTALVGVSPAVKSANFLLACMAVCRVPSFDPKRLIAAAGKCRSKLVAYSHRDDFLSALEEIYNFNRTAAHMFGLKLEAIRVMRERGTTGPKQPVSKTPEPV